ncbi:hypothetical protein CDL60_11635 [Roseateles noduli]|nr:hypothetical protein CDL60_11635 [Roseateles noduli]
MPLPSQESATRHSSAELGLSTVVAEADPAKPPPARSGEDVLPAARTDDAGAVRRLLAAFDRPGAPLSTDGFIMDMRLALHEEEDEGEGAGEGDASQVEGVVGEVARLQAWDKELRKEAQARDGGAEGSIAVARDPVPERGLIAYIHEAMTPLRPGSDGHPPTGAGGRPPPALLGEMYDALFVRWRPWINRGMLRILSQAADAILDGRFPNVYEGILGALIGGNPSTPLPADGPASTRTIRVSTAIFLDFLEKMADVIDNDGSPRPTAGLLRQAALLRLTRDALLCGLARTPVTIEIDRIRGDLAAPTPKSAAAIDVLKQAYRALEELARQGVIVGIRFQSGDASRRTDPRWRPLDAQRSWTDDDQLSPLIPDLAPLPLAASAEEALADLGLDGRSDLDRAAGTLRVGPAVRGERTTEIRFDPLPEEASPERQAAQERQLLTLARLLRLSGLADVPVRRWPAALSIGQDGFKAGSLVVARADDRGRWRIDDAAQRRLLRVLPEASNADALTPRPASAWKNHIALHDDPDHPDRDAVQALDPLAVEGHQPLRIYVALQDDQVIDQIGQALYRKYAKHVVLVRLAEDGSWSVRHGRPLLSDALFGKRAVRLILGGHGQMDPATKAMVIAGYTPERIADSIGRLLSALRPDATTAVERTRLLACALDSPTAQGSFGRAFAKAADTAGWAAPGMRTTAYSDLVVNQLLSSARAGGDDHFFTRIDASGQDVRRAAGVTWQYRVEDGEVRGEDKYPGGGPGLPAKGEGERFLLGDAPEQGAAARMSTLSREERAAESLRVREALATLAQVPAEVLPRCASISGTDARRMSEYIQIALSQGAPDDAAKVFVMEVADDIMQGLLGDMTLLRRAYARLSDRWIDERTSVEHPQGWLARANVIPEAQALVHHLGGRPVRITTASNLFLDALTAARISLDPDHSGSVNGNELHRIFGRIQLLHAAVGAAATNGAIVIDLSAVEPISEQAASRDNALYRSRTVLQHLKRLGIVREVAAWSLGRPQDGPPPLPGRWRSAGVYRVGPEVDGILRRVSVSVASLEDGMITGAFPNMTVDKDGVWSPFSHELLAELVARLKRPLAEALPTLRTLLQAHKDANGSRFEYQRLQELVRDVQGRLDRLRRDTGPAWTFGSFRREILTPAAVTPLDDDAAVDLPGMQRALGPVAGPDRAHAAMETYQSAMDALAEQLSRDQVAFGASRPADAPEFIDLLRDDQPFPALRERALHVRQSLDRAAGLIRLVHPRTDIVTEVRIDPLGTDESDGAAARLAMARQDADIRSAEALILRLVRMPDAGRIDHPEALGDLPRNFSLRDGAFSVNAQVIARRRGAATEAVSGLPSRAFDPCGLDGWEIDIDGLTSAALTLRRAPSPDFSTHLVEYGLPVLPEPVVEAPPSRLKVIVQLAGDIDSTTAAWLLSRKYRGSSAWLQMESGHDSFEAPRIVRAFGQALMQAADASTEVDIVVVGHSGMALAEDQTLSGWTPQQLADGLLKLFELDMPQDEIDPHLAEAFQGLIKERVQSGNAGPRNPASMPRLRRVSLAACDTLAPAVVPSFAVEFIKQLGGTPGWASDAEVVARTGHVHVTEHVEDGTERIVKLTSRFDSTGRTMRRHRMPGDTKVLVLDKEDGHVTIVDKYADPVEDSARQWQRPEEELQVSFDSSLRDTVPTPLIRLFSDAHGQVDEDRMRRVARDPGEVRQLAADLAASFAALPESRRDAVTAQELMAGSLAGRWVRLDGREVPLKDLVTPGADADRDPLRDAHVLDGLVRQAMDADPLGLEALSRTTAEDALHSLRASGLVSVDAAGAARLIEQPLQALVAGDDDAGLMRAGAAMLHLPQEVFESLRAGAGPQGLRLLDKAQDVRKGFAGGWGRAAGAPSGVQPGDQPGVQPGDQPDGAGQAAAGHATTLLNTVIATAQLVQGWRHMDATMKGLLVTQTASPLITPLTVKVGQWLRGLSSTVSAGATTATSLERALSTIGTALEGGAADLGLAGLGMVVVGLQWDEFRRSGQGTDSFAFRSLVANTTVMTFFTATSLASAGVQVAAAFAGGAEAIAGTALGLAAGVVAEAALPLALLMIAVNGAVGGFMWADEYGDYIRGSTDLGDVIGAGVAKFFGIETDVLRRAEVEKSAVGAAKAREKMRDQARSGYLEFRAEQLARSGYGTVMSPQVVQAVDHATFRVPQQDPSHTFVLQDREVTPAPAPTVPGLDGFDRQIFATSPSGTAWLDLRHSPATGIPASTADGQQLFELQGAWGRVTGAAGRDVFLLDADGQGDIDGKGGQDEVDMDATGSEVRLHHDTVTGRLALVTVGAATPKRAVLRRQLTDIDSVTIRNATRAEVVGGPADERFDVSAPQTTIAGGGGRNTYVLRAGNRIVSSSDDALIWSGDVNASVDVFGERPGKLLLKVEVPHDTLSFRRLHGTRLVIASGSATLTLEGFFRPTSDVAPAGPPPLFIVDALGTHLTLIDPSRLDAQERPSAQIDKHLFLDASTPSSRRALTGDHAHTRHHLASGGGDFLLRPRTAMPMDVTLDLPLDRLRYRRDGDDLVLVETPPADAAPDFTPLRLRLPGYGRRDWAASHGQLALWARAGAGKDERTATKLRHPTLSDPDEGPVQGTAQEVARNAPSETPKTATAALAPEPAPLPAPGTEVLTGTDGADVYAVADDQHVVIDNRSISPTRDLLKLGSVRRLRRSGADLVIETWSGGSVTLRRHATDPLARHVSLDMGGHRYALPVIHDSGVMVYGPDADEGDIDATLPGTHVVPTAPEAAWRETPERRIVRLGPQARLHRMGRSIDVRGQDRRVIFKDILLSPRLASQIVSGMPESAAEGFSPRSALDAPWHDAANRLKHSTGRGNVFLAAALDASDIQDPASMRDVATLWRQVDSGKGQPDQVFPVDTVRAFLRMGGLPHDIAGAVHATTLGQVRRIRALLAAFVDGKTWPSAALLDDFAASSATLPLSASRHGAMLRRLAAQQRPWAYQVEVLAGDLTPQALDAFEDWAGKRLGGTTGDADSLLALQEFKRLLSGQPQADQGVTSHTRELLRIALKLHGRPDDVTDQLVDAMTAVTLDEAWVDGMLQAGVVDHAALKRLWAEKIPVRDLLLSNANRLAYEGPGTRTGLIDVTVSSGLRQPDAKVFRSVVKAYLALDDNGDHFATQDPAPVPGTSYDLVPGDVVDQWGQSPDVEDALLDWDLARMDLEAEYEDKHADSYWKLEISRNMSDRTRQSIADSLAKGKASYVKRHSPALSALAHLREAGLIETTSTVVPGATGAGRSTPDNLVDGQRRAGEATAWRPFARRSPAGDGKPERLLPVELDGSTSIQFTLDHPVALSTLSLHLRQDGRLDAERTAVGRWRVEARNQRSEWIPVSEDFKLDAAELADQRTLFLDDSLPYRHFRLVGLDGQLSPGTWFSEVTFTTVEAGAPTWRERFQRLGYDLHRSRVMISLGYATDEGLARAAALPAGFRQASNGELYLAMKFGVTEVAPGEFQANRSPQPGRPSGAWSAAMNLAQAAAAGDAPAGAMAGATGGAWTAKAPSPLSLLAATSP